MRICTFTFHKFQEKNLNLKWDSNSDLQISSLALYQWAIQVLIPIHLQTLLLKCLPLFYKAVRSMTLPAIYWSLSELTSLLNKYNVLKLVCLMINRWQVVEKWQTFQEESLKVNWNKNQDSSMPECQTRDLEVRVRIPVQVQIFLLKFMWCKCTKVYFH